MNRIDEIAGRLFTHWTAVGANAIPVDLAQWDPRTDRLHAPFGYMMPIFEKSPEKIDCTIFFCPELIDVETTWLSDEDFDAYLDCLQYHVDWRIVNHELDEDAADDEFARILADKHVGSLSLMNAVQMAALDSFAD